MELFGAQLAAVRKQKGYTQEQLAEKLNVSRTTISRWESGKIIPDLETVRLLSQILEYDFFTAKEPTSDSIFPSPNPAPQPDASGTRFRKWILAGAGALLLGLALLAFLLLRRPAAFRQANVVITPTNNPEYVIRSEEYFPEAGAGWFYEFRYEETAGVPFTVQKAVLTTIGDDDREYNDFFTGEQVAQWFEGSSTLTKGAPKCARGGFSLQDMKGVRITLIGTDAYGNELTFQGSVELSKEFQD